MSSGIPVFARHYNTPESHQNPKHDRDLPVSSCSWFVTRNHVMSDRHGTLRSPEFASTLWTHSLEANEPLALSRPLLIRGFNEKVCDKRPRDVVARKTSKRAMGH